VNETTKREVINLIVMYNIVSCFRGNIVLFIEMKETIKEK